MVVRGGALLLLIGDLIAFFGALIVTLFLRYGKIPSRPIIEAHLEPFIILFFVWILTFYIAGLYDRYISFVRKSIPAVVLRVQFLNMLIAGIVFFAFPFAIAPKTNLVIYLFVSSAFIVVWRLYVFPRITTRKKISALIIGESEESMAIARVFAKNHFFKHVRPFILSKRDIQDFEEFRAALKNFASTDSTDMIIADMRDPYVERLVPDLYSLAFEGLNVRFFNLSTIYEQLHHRLPPTLIGEAWLLEHMTAEAPHYAYAILKRVIDMVGALMLLFPAIVLTPFIVTAIRLEGAGPFLYRTTRVGQYNRNIELIKFRTMTGCDTGEDALQSVLRPTRVGAFLRKTRLDELPQLINILKGDLSFIGPRPEIPTLVAVYAEHIPYYNLRHLVKPGLSGWAQINNFDVPRGGVDVKRTIDKLSFDLYYLKHRSLILDCEIALKTINTLLMRSGT